MKIKFSLIIISLLTFQFCATNKNKETVVQNKSKNELYNNSFGLSTNYDSSCVEFILVSNFFSDVWTNINSEIFPKTFQFNSDTSIKSLSGKIMPNDSSFQVFNADSSKFIYDNFNKLINSGQCSYSNISIEEIKNKFNPKVIFVFHNMTPDKTTDTILLNNSNDLYYKNKIYEVPNTFAWLNFLKLPTGLTYIQKAKKNN